MQRLILLTIAFLVLVPGTGNALEIRELSSESGVTFDVVVTATGEWFTALGDNDATTDRFDVVVLGDGYDASETDQARLTEAAVTFVGRLLEVPPYSELAPCINFWLINLVSKDSGIGDPDHDYESNTALHCSFKTGSMEIATVSSENLADDVCSLAGLDPDAIFVILRDSYNHDGAMARYSNAIAYVSDLFQWGTVAAHELGHVIGRLADEYRAPQCYLDSDCVTVSGTAIYVDFWDPEEPNLTIETDASLVKWADILQTGAFPTTIDSVVNGTVLGRWEGGEGKCFGVYRPRQSCLMDGVTGQNPATDTFCPVCVRSIVNRIETEYGCPAD
jgi:hypothetical protein